MSVEAITNGINILGIAENNNAQPSHVRVPQFGSSRVDEFASESRVLVGGSPVTNANTLDGKKSAATVDTATLNKWSQNFTVDKSTYAVAKIRATFYPKFENEKPDKKDVRDRMIELVSEGHATLEVSLKLSGSLFMYAGHKGGAYSKNSFGNIYTAVGVFVLGRTFRQAWGTEASKKQAEFNDFLEREHMSVSMELVTAVLGDHGQRPRKDFVVVTAVTELGNGKPKFYSTLDIIAFCRKWRLPTNHVWLFSTRSSLESFFVAYDMLYEEGIATTVCMALDELADISVPGSIDHVMMQGEILEGLVARIVSHVSTKQMDLVLEKYPSPVEEVNQDLGPSLREICAANRSDEKQLIMALLRSTGPAFCPDYMDWFGVEAADVTPRDADKSIIHKFLQANASDYSTTKLKDMVHAMEKKPLLAEETHFLADFKCYPNYHKINLISGDNLHYKMVIHVRHDETFVKYQKTMRTKPNLWPLYRGFFVEINLFKASKEKTADIAKNSPNVEKSDGFSDDTSTKNGLADEDANLMIKLKFLTYKLRTFLIRNGLLFKGNSTAYREQYVKLMNKWNVSQEKQEALTEMLDEWFKYITGECKGRQLSSTTYLSAAEPFLEQYAKLSSQNQALIGFAGDLVRTEDFLAIEEKILEPSSPTVGCIQKKGLIVFFPGIPGCAKSALCEEIINASKYLEDDRPVRSFMGDLIKKKYWQIVEDVLRKKPYPIVLADKNAPNIEVLMQIERMSHSTNASAVPIVPDSEGTESNPFALDALAVFIHRVLNRDNHPGNLDKKSSNVGHVLLKFYHLYDGESRSEFESKLIGRFGSLVKMPLLKSDRTPLPDSVKTKLEEGIHLCKLRGLKSTKGTDISPWDAWEKQLREILHENDEYLRSIQVPFETVFNKVLEQLKIIMKGEYVAPINEKKKFASMVFASVDVPIEDIHDLSNLFGKDTKVKTFLENKNINLTKAHLTLAHKASHGVAAVAKYGQFMNQNVPIDVTALLFSDKLAALEAHPGCIDGQKINSKNEWPHLTLWTDKDIPAKEANTLPQLVSQGLATRVEINPPFRISGVLQLH